jgi:signal transduction histidine kinase
MAFTHPPAAFRLSPLGALLVILAVIFLAEAGVMLVLPFLVQHNQQDAWPEALLDASMLTLLVAPVLWWLIFRPLRTLAEFRSRLLAKIIEVQESERRRIAQDLHDQIGQSLASLLVGLRMVEQADSIAVARGRAQELRQGTATALDEVRRIAHGLRPSVLDRLGLGAAIERLVEDFQSDGVQVRAELGSLADARLPEQVETALYRIAQEALTNAVRHSNARNVRVVLELHAGEIAARIEDDGIGLKEGETAAPRAGRLGMGGMRERAELVGGSFAVESRRGRGTTVRVSVPLPEALHGKDSRTARR